MIIYKTTNLINGIIYIGKYCGNRKSYIGSGRDFREDVKEYGRDNFTRETLEDGITDHDYLCERERYWITFYNSTNPEIGYNLTNGGAGTFGRIFSEENKKKLSINNSGENSSSAKLKETDVIEILKLFYIKNITRKEISNKYNVSYYTVVDITVGKTWKIIYNNFMATHMTVIICRNSKDISGKNNPNFGKPMSEAQKQKISNTLKTSKIQYGENNPNSKLTENNVLKILDLFYNQNINTKEINKKYNISRSAINRLVAGKQWKDTYDEFMSAQK